MQIIECHYVKPFTHTANLLQKTFENKIYMKYVYTCVQMKQIVKNIIEILSQKQKLLIMRQCFHLSQYVQRSSATNVSYCVCRWERVKITTTQYTVTRYTGYVVDASLFLFTERKDNKFNWNMTTLTALMYHVLHHALICYTYNTLNKITKPNNSARQQTRDKVEYYTARTV